MFSNWHLLHGPFAQLLSKCRTATNTLHPLTRRLEKETLIVLVFYRSGVSKRHRYQLELTSLLKPRHETRDLSCSGSMVLATPEREVAFCTNLSIRTGKAASFVVFSATCWPRIELCLLTWEEGWRNRGGRIGLGLAPTFKFRILLLIGSNNTISIRSIVTVNRFMKKTFP